jgi:phosphatidylinositol 4-kinase
MNNNENKEKVEIILQSIKYANEHPNETPNLNIIDNTPTSTINNSELDSESALSSIEDPFGEDYIDIENSIKQNSKFKNYKSLTIKNIICKANDDLRQEVLTMQLIKKFDEIFKKENLPLQLHPYEIVITSSSSGIIEYLPDTISIDSLKKKLLEKKISVNNFCRYYFRDNFEEFQKNFVESLAAYCIVCYLIQIKDRHNGNILLDKKGRIIHIDFGFILGISPGNLNFENAPFKITKDYIAIMDGQKSEMFFYFVSIMARGLQMIRKYANIFCNIVEAMGIGVPMPCFNGRNYKDVVASFKERFLTNCSDQEVINVVENLVDKAVNSWRTTYYDIFQKYTNGIIP